MSFLKLDVILSDVLFLRGVCKPLRAFSTALGLKEREILPKIKSFLAWRLSAHG